MSHAADSPQDLPTSAGCPRDSSSSRSQGCCPFRLPQTYGRFLSITIRTKPYDTSNVIKIKQESVQTSSPNNEATREKKNKSINEII